ncbi:MAG: hypothetical protein AAFR61_15105 [Bacteroidota bacterium]
MPAWNPKESINNIPDSFKDIYEPQAVYALTGDPRYKKHFTYLADEIQAAITEITGDVSLSPESHFLMKCEDDNGCFYRLLEYDPTGLGNMALRLIFKVNPDNTIQAPYSPVGAESCCGLDSMKYHSSTIECKYIGEGLGFLVANLTLDWREGNSGIWDVSASGSFLKDGSGVEESTPASLALLTYSFYLEGSLIYQAQIGAGADVSNPASWTYLGGARTSSNFTSEVIAHATGSGFAWAFNKKEWAYQTGYIDDAAGHNDPRDLDMVLTLQDVAENLSALSPSRRADIKISRGTFSQPYFMTLDQGEIMLSDYGNHAIRMVRDDALFGKRLVTIAGAMPRGAISGFSPAYPAGPVDGKDARFTFPEGLDLAISIPKVNEKYEAWGWDRTNKQLRRIIRKATTVDHEGENWEVYSEDLTVSYAFPSLSIDPVRTMGGKPIFYDGHTGLYVHYWDEGSSSWQANEISSLFDSGVNRVSVSPSGDLVVSYYESNVPKCAVLRNISPDSFLNPADWQLIGVVFEWEENYEGYANQVVAEVNGLPVIIAPHTTSGEIRLYTHNGGTSLTPNDWTEIVMADVDPNLGAVRPVDMRFEESTNRLYLSNFGTHQLIYLDLTTQQVFEVAGRESEPGFENDVRY